MARQAGTGITTQLQEKCAVFGAYGAGPETARLTFYGLWALQHRGQESSGIVSSDGKELHRHTGQGLVANVYHEEDLEQLPGSVAIGHNRYSTHGGSDSRHNQPFADNERLFAFAHNGNLPVQDKLVDFLAKRKVDIAGLNDSGMMFRSIGCYMDDGLKLPEAIQKAFPLFQGAFSAVAMGPKQLIAFRDQCGIRPLSIGKVGSGYVVASETCAFETIGATFVRDVRPGEMVVIDKDGLTSHQIVESKLKLDIFELIYFARPDSVLLGMSVNEVRKKLGHQLAKEYPVDADVIVPVPDSSIPMALGYAAETGIPFEMGLVKNRYIHRTFIRPTAELRKRDVQMKLNPVVAALKGKRVVLIDDSIVRGTTMRQTVKMMYAAGVKELHVLVSSPPVRFPDFYGINTPDQKDLIGSYMTLEEMTEHLGPDSLYFLSYEGTVKATGLPKDTFCTSCFDGDYPISIGKNAKHITHKQPQVVK